MDRGPGCGLIPILVDARVKPGALHINTASTHLRRVVHIYASANYVMIASDYGYLFTGPVGTHANEIVFKILKWSSKYRWHSARLQ